MIHAQYRSYLAALRQNGLLSVVLGLLVACGCSRNYDNQVKSLNGSNIQRLSNIYGGFQASRMGQGPKNEADLKQFIQTLSADSFQLMGIDPNNKDAVLISERDHKPFKVRYGVDCPFGAVAAVVFEQDGVGGKYQVGFTNAKVEEAVEARYKELWEGRGGAKPEQIGGTPPPDVGGKK